MLCLPAESQCQALESLFEAFESKDKVAHSQHLPVHEVAAGLMAEM